MLAFVVEIGTHLEEAAVCSVLVVTVGGYMGAWRRGGAERERRSFRLRAEDPPEDPAVDAD